MKKLLMIIPLVFLLCFTFGYQKSEEVAEEPVVDVEADVAAIKALLDEYDVSLNAGDVEKLVSLNYAEDAVRMPPNEPMSKGKAAILAWFKKEAEHYTLQMEEVPEDVQVDGDLAFMRSTFAGTGTPKAGGEPVQVKGKGIAVYKRQVDGSWKVICDIYNSDDLPLPTSPEKE